MNPFDDPGFVGSFLEKRQSPRSINNVLDTPTLLQLIGDLAGKTVIEIGCGAGDMAQQLEPTLLKLYRGIDCSTAFISAARRRVGDSRFSFEVLDASIFLPRVTADVVVSGLTLHFIENLDGVLRAVFRALVLNGLFVFSVRHPIRTSNPGGGLGEGRWVVEDYCREGKRIHRWHEAECPLYHRTISTWFCSLQSAGFQILDIREPITDAQSVLEEDTDHCTVPGALFFKCVKSRT